jgi:biotin transport system substrate-specific component
MSQLLLDRTEQRILGAHLRILDAAIVLGASLLMALCAHISIPLVFTPVPITLQTFGVLFLALSLGRRRAVLSLLVYLIEGASGLPVFSPHGPGGIAQLLGPTGGYLMAYPVAAFVGGVIADKLSRKGLVLAFSLGAIVCDAVILFAGALWLLLLIHKSSSAIMAAAVLTFLPGEILKGAAAVAAALAAKKLAR